MLLLGFAECHVVAFACDLCLDPVLRTFAWNPNLGYLLERFAWDLCLLQNRVRRALLYGFIRYTLGPLLPRALVVKITAV